MTRSRRDTNEAELVEYWRACGCVWIPQAREAGFDGLLIYQGKCHIVEIKNGKHWRLTQNESNLRDQLGDLYRIVTGLDDAMKLILEG